MRLGERRFQQEARRPCLRRFLRRMSPEQKKEKSLEVGQFLETLACTYRDAKKFEQAKQAGEESLRAYEELGEKGLAVNAVGYAEVLCTNGTIAKAAGDNRAAADWFHRALTTLNPHFQKDRANLNQLMKKLWTVYQETLAKEGKSPDSNLRSIGESLTQ